MSKRATHEVHEAIREILLNMWDPIGVRDVPQAQDEYDDQVGGVYHLLATGASNEEIADHLERIERSHMGMIGGEPERTLQRLAPVVEHLKAIDLGKS